MSRTVSHERSGVCVKRNPIRRRKRRAFVALDAFIGACIIALTALLYFAAWRQLDYAVACSDAIREARLSCESELARLRAIGVALPPLTGEPQIATSTQKGTTITTTLTAATGPWTGMVRADVVATRPTADRPVSVQLSAFLIAEELQ